MAFPALAPLLYAIVRYAAAHFLAGLAIKAFMLAAVWWMFDEFYDVVVGLIPQFPLTQQFLNALPEGVWWFLDLAQLDFGIPIVLTAYFYAFTIRRIPVIG